VKQSFTAHMPLLMETRSFGLWTRRLSSPKRCYVHYFRTIIFRLNNPLRYITAQDDPLEATENVSQMLSMHWCQWCCC